MTGCAQLFSMRGGGITGNGAKMTGAVRIPHGGNVPKKGWITSRPSFTFRTLKRMAKPRSGYTTMVTARVKLFGDH
jgi:hypothetical protein